MFLHYEFFEGNDGPAENFEYEITWEEAKEAISEALVKRVFGAYIVKHPEGCVRFTEGLTDLIKIAVKTSMEEFDVLESVTSNWEEYLERYFISDARRAWNGSEYYDRNASREYGMDQKYFL